MYIPGGTTGRLSALRKPRKTAFELQYWMIRSGKEVCVLLPRGVGKAWLGGRLYIDTVEIEEALLSTAFFSWMVLYSYSCIDRGVVGREL